MNWRWIAVALVVLALVDALFGVMVYGSKTWNFDHTEVLAGWAAVREVCLVFFPITMGGTALVAAVLVFGARWARRGGR